MQTKYNSQYKCQCLNIVITGTTTVAVNVSSHCHCVVDVVIKAQTAPLVTTSLLSDSLLRQLVNIYLDFVPMNFIIIVNFVITIS